MNTLYRFYDTEGTLLYVGLSVNPGRRMEKHKATQPWWAEVARIVLEQHPDLAALRAAERTAIQAESPRYNIKMNGRGSTSERVALLRSRGWTRISAHGSQSWTHPQYGRDVFTLSAAVGRETEPAPPSPPVEEPPRGLTGRWFHSYNPDGHREWQGQIIDRDGDLFIAQLYSWWDGCASNQVVCEIADMRSWRFYPSNEAMLTANGCEETIGSNQCGAPCTHVIRDWHGMGAIYRCSTCIAHYSGKVETL